MKKILLLSALVSAGLSTAVAAQDAATPPPVDPVTPAPPAASTMPAPVAPVPPAASANATGTELLTDQQADGQRLASKLIGSAVYSTEGERVGSINDVIISGEGAVRGYVVGVGGFLGVGEKDVAMAFNAVMPSVDNNGNPRFLIHSTKDMLEKAPPFRTADKG